ncbi:hypothetical protein [Nocardia ignorata]|uniref:Uncharacterized protein n=1 Tax=Nocardia ignorata TaxID=145285 RepID=A0A4R6P258_NOCIG|nr:hypothetical protein [Nocardia ignorata]TDP31597.1 hypothetical protein DFR75_108202 [Nocardia ignorata]
MSHPLSGAEDLPSWQLRLLERIQNASYDHYRTLFHGSPQYSPASGASVQLETWRTHLRALDDERGEIALHAHARGVPQRMIDYATETGARGARWGDTPETTTLPMAPPGADPARLYLLDQLAEDVWRLEHTALVRAEYLHRVHTGALPDNEPAERQLHDNMAALWRRATGTAALINVQPGEAEQLWGRSLGSWQQLAELTAASYTDAELRQRFTEMSWKGVEADLSRTFDNLATTTVTDLGPPTPWEFAQRAEQALAAVSFADNLGPGAGHGIGTAVEATGIRTAAQWEPDPDLQPHPPDRGPGSGVDQGVW